MNTIVLDLKPQLYSTYDCFQSSLVKVAEYLRKDYELIFTDSLFFKFKQNRNNHDYKPLGSRLLQLSSRELALKDKKVYRNYLAKIHGLQFRRVPAIRLFDQKCIIANELKKKLPVIIGFDAFYCSWTLAYLKQHMLHYFTVIGIDKDNKQFYIQDPYLSKKNETLSFNNFQKGSRYLQLYKITDRKMKEPTIEQFLAIIKENYNKHNTDYVKDINAFADEFQTYLNFEKECRGYANIELVPFFIQLKRISDNRINASSLFHYLYRKMGIEDLNQLAEHIKNIGLIWKQLRIDIIYLIIRYEPSGIKKTAYTNFADRISSLSDLEEQFLKDLLNLEKKVCNEKSYGN